MHKIKKPCGFHCIKMKDIGVSFGDQVVLEHINLHIHCGSLTALIGRNGAGKSTLIKILSGVYQPDEGALIKIDGKETVINNAIDAITDGLIP